MPGRSGANPWIIGTARFDADSVSVALLEVLCPAGTIRTTFHSLADTGWLLFGQTVANAAALYPTLWAKLPAVLKSGTSLILPTDDEWCCVATHRHRRRFRVEPGDVGDGEPAGPRPPDRP